MNIDDPKLTAFALDELEEPERSTIARATADSPEAQRYIEEMRELADALEKEFAAELQHEDARTGAANLTDIRDDPWFWAKARPLALAAAMAVFAVVAAIAVGTYKKGRDSFRAVAVEYPLIDAQQSTASDFAGSATVPNPLRRETIARIERVVIGELDTNPQSDNGELRLIEVIHDTYRIERLKQRLSVPILSKQSLRTLAGHRYGLIFLDRTGAVVASARFYRLANERFVLQPVKKGREENGRYFVGQGWLVPGDWENNVDYRAYAIPFPDWNECIGYMPGA
jgi:hypothetical protein